MVVFVWEDYRMYAYCIFVLSATSIIVTIYETRRNNETIRQMARYVCSVELASGRQVWSDELVPGDVIRVPSNVVFPCDMILLKGSAIVNESILTGESIPVIKQELPGGTEVYSKNSCQKHTLFGGTLAI